MLFTEIKNTTNSFDFKQISEERKTILQPLVDSKQSQQ